MTRIYPPSRIKAGKRHRATKAEMEQRYAALFDIVSEMQPMTVRQVFYQASVRGILDKTESSYDKVQVALVRLRRAKVIPYDWIADNTRWQRRPRTFNSPEEALLETARYYRKALWRDSDVYVELWLEKDALAGVIYPVTSLYDVSLMVARGFSSLSFLYSSAQYIKSLDVPAYIYHLGDFDPSGVKAAEKIEETLREMAPEAEIYFERLAVTEGQIREWNLPTRPTKETDSRARNFTSKVSVELDAIDPTTLRDLVRQTIEQHLPDDQLEVLKAAEESEREMLTKWAEALTKRRGR